MSELNELPHNTEAEISVLGGILLDNDAIDKVLEIISPSDFYKDANRDIFTAMVSIAEKKEPIILISLHEALKNNAQGDDIGAGYLASLADEVPTAANIEYYAKIVKEKSDSRKLINIGWEISNKGFDGSISPDDVVESAQDELLNIQLKTKSSDFKHVKQITKNSFKAIENIYENKSITTGVPSGFESLDYKTSGFQKSDLIIIAGRPSMGKTAFALNLAMNAFKEEDKDAVAIFSLEMSEEQLVMRLLCSEAKVDASMMKRGILKESDWPKLTRAAGTIVNKEIYINDEAGITVTKIRSKCLKLKTEKGLGMVIIDYLQLMGDKSGAKSREQEIANISRSLKGLAKELNVPVIALSQLSRAVEQRGGDKRPMLSDLRESGSIEQDADVVLFVYREEFYKRDDDDLKGIAEIIIGKQRNGPIGTVKLAWQEKYTRFDNLSEQEISNMKHWQE